MCLIKQGFYLELHVGSTLETCAYSMRLNAGGRGGDTIASYWTGGWKRAVRTKLDSKEVEIWKQLTSSTEVLGSIAQSERIFISQVPNFPT